MGLPPSSWWCVCTYRHALERKAHSVLHPAGVRFIVQNSDSKNVHSLVELVQCQSKIYSTFLDKITKYNQRHQELNHRSEDY